MKYKYYNITALTLLIFACQNDDLPTANFNLNTISDITAEAGHEKVGLSWLAPENKTPKKIILKWSPNGKTVELNPTTLSYEVLDLTNGTNYNFVVQSDYGTSGISGEKSVKISPQNQLNFTVLPGNRLAIAKWKTPVRNDIIGYSLSWSPNGQNIDLTSDATVYQVTGLNNDTEYTFNLVAKYQAGNNSDIVQYSATPGGEIPAFRLNIESPMSTQEVEFTYNSAFLPQSTATAWNWNFGDGTSSNTDENPTHTFSSPGTYEVQIQITDGDGLNHSDSRMIKVWGEKWSYNIGSQIKIQIPTIADDGTIYIGSEDNNNFHAINSDGSLKWTYAGLGDNVYSSASIGSDGTIYVGAKDSKLHAINPDGTSKWKFTMSGYPNGASPAIASDGTIYIGTDGDNMYAINPDGTEKWVFSTSTFNVRSTPAIATDGTVYIASDDNNLYALNPATGTMNWSFDIGGDVDGGVAIDGNGTIIVSVDKGGSTGAVYAVNPDGTEKWSTTTSGRILSSPAIANGRVYVGTKDINKLYAFDSSNGTELWSFTAGHIILSSPSVDRNGTIYFGSFDNHVYAINSDGTEKYKFDTGSKVWSSVVIGSDGTAYIGGYDGKLHAFEFFAEGLATDAWPMFAKNVKHTGR